MDNMEDSLTSKNTPILDLPVDIILLILPYLDPRSFLSLTSTCHALHKPIFLHDTTYWSHRTRSDFRLPNRPANNPTGRHWSRLYRRLTTQSRVYTWGDNSSLNLGQPLPTQPTPPPTAQNPISSHPRTRMLPTHLRHRPRPVNPVPKVHIPTPIAPLPGNPLIVDIHCGGWSTVYLTSRGALYLTGILDASRPFHRAAQGVNASAVPLRYPPGATWPWPEERYDAATAVRSVSVGRAHVLALSDSGRVWGWRDAGRAGVAVKVLGVDFWEEGWGAEGRWRKGNVRCVVAGWSLSAALVEGRGIVVWEPVGSDGSDAGETDTVLIMESAVVEGTGWKTGRVAKDKEDERLEREVGEVLGLVVLEQIILYYTSLGKVFAVRMDKLEISPPVELPLTSSGATDEITSGATFATDVQGSFRKAAIFLRDGSVLTIAQDVMVSFMEDSSSQSSAPDAFPWARPPSLQHTGVIRMAFGDHHNHALHASGHITSFGHEPRGCGALGLGKPANLPSTDNYAIDNPPNSLLRGLGSIAVTVDSTLVPHAAVYGRRVWFEQEKRAWLAHLAAGGADPDEAQERMRLMRGAQGFGPREEISEWIEQEGRDWEGRYGGRKLVTNTDDNENETHDDNDDDNDDGLPAYFALTVSAAGWHSGALVLVNEKLADRIRKGVEVIDQVEEPTLDDTEKATLTQPEEQTPSSDDNSASQSLSLTERLTDYGQYFLGVGPYNPVRRANAEQTAQDDAASTGTPASPRPGVSYVWAKERFPRLKMRNGIDMPGQVELSEWRYGKPDWDMKPGYYLRQPRS